VALWGVIGAAGNLMKLDGAYAMVEAATRMPGFEPGAASPRATDQPVTVGLGVLLIVLGTLAPAALSSWGAVRTGRARNESAEAWQQSKSTGPTKRSPWSTPGV